MVGYDAYVWERMPPLVEVDPVIPPAEVATILAGYRDYARRCHPEYSEAQVEHLARTLFNGMVPERAERRLARNAEWEALGLMMWPDPLRPATTKSLLVRRSPVLAG